MANSPFGMAFRILDKVFHDAYLIRILLYYWLSGNQCL